MYNKLNDDELLDHIFNYIKTQTKLPDELLSILKDKDISLYDDITYIERSYEDLC